jgi:predicted methyltransferase
MTRTTTLLASSALAAVLALSVGCATTGGTVAAKPSAAVVAAVADKARPDADRARDADRKPAELIAFAGIKAGDKVGDIMPGGGYFTRLFSGVVGSKGAVYALAPVRAANAPANAPDMAAGVKAIAADPHYANVKVGALDVAVPVPEKVDVMWTSLNYHDFHNNRPDNYLKTFNKWVYDALKPGGTYIVIDHAAKAGAGKSVTSTLHRIEPAYVKQDVIAAGFEFVGESKVLENPADDRSKLNRESDIRGKTDQFAFKFRKPK